MGAIIYVTLTGVSLVHAGVLFRQVVILLRS